MIARVGTNVRMSPDLHSRLTRAADERAVPLNWLICKLLTESLDALIPPDEIRLVRKAPS